MSWEESSAQHALAVKLQDNCTVTLISWCLAATEAGDFWIGPHKCEEIPLGPRRVFKETLVDGELSKSDSLYWWVWFYANVL